MLDVSSEHGVVVRPERGQADDPQRAGDRAREAAEPADHRDRDEVERVGDGEEAFGVADRHDEPAEQRAAEAGDESAERERGELGPGRRHGERGRGRLVLAHADDRAADPGAAQVAGDREHDHEARRARSSSSCG